MRAMTYNILNGGVDGCDQARLDTIAKVIIEQDPDVVALQEAMHFASDRARLLYQMERQLDRRGFLAEARTGQHVALFIRREQPVIWLEIDNYNFHHALIRLRLQTADGGKITVLATHLCPHGSLNRLAEVQRIANDAKDDHGVVLMGDLNSLDHYEDHTADVAKLAGRYRARHLIPGEFEQVDDRVTRTLEAAGFVDIGHSLKAADQDISTAPTKIKVAGQEFSGMRVDYIYANAYLAAKARSCMVVRTPDTDYASDHYPVVADFGVAIL